MIVVSACHDHPDLLSPHARSLGHINNLYNTAFWALVQQGKQSEKEAEMTLNVSQALTRVSEVKEEDEGVIC